MNHTATVAEERQATREETFNQRLCHLETLARPMVPDIFIASVVSISAAATVWLLLFAKYAFDSLSSIVLCTLILVMLSVPGTVLLGLWVSLRDVARIRAAAGVRAQPVAPSDPIQEPPAGDLKGRALGLLRSVWRKLETLLEIRDQVLFIEDELQALRSASSTLRLAASGPALIAIAVSGAFSVLLVLAAALAAVKFVLGIVF